jgi:hypothetical protein
LLKEHNFQDTQRFENAKEFLLTLTHQNPDADYSIGKIVT